MTALNNDIREKLVAKVIADLPPITDNRAAMRDEAHAAAIALLPEAIQTIYKDEKLREYLSTRSYSVGTISVPDIPYAGSGWYQKEERVFGEEMAAKLREASDAVEVARRERKQLSDTLLQDFKAVKTFKAFREAYPEFAKYLPEEASAKSGAMVRSDAVERAKALGWRDEA